MSIQVARCRRRRESSVFDAADWLMSLQTAQWIIIRFCELYQDFCKLLLLLCDRIVQQLISVLRSIHDMYYVKTQLLC